MVQTAALSRRFGGDGGDGGGLKLREFPVPCNAGSMTEAHLARALQILRDEPKPLLIHCWHGSDRTGTVVAASGWRRIRRASFASCRTG